MGFDIVAYFVVDQQQIDDFIANNNIDCNDFKQDYLIENYYKSQNPEMKDLHIIYCWNEECKLHEIFDSYGTNFIRDDPRFLNGRFTQNLPYCLQNINFSLNSAEDAIEIADAINIFFKKDDKYMSFAYWLRTTSKHCDMYELSY